MMNQCKLFDNLRDLNKFLVENWDRIELKRVSYKPIIESNLFRDRYFIWYQYDEKVAEEIKNNDAFLDLSNLNREKTLQSRGLQEEIKPPSECCLKVLELAKKHTEYKNKKIQCGVCGIIHQL